MANSFFKNGDKAYSENLNDGILVGNAFDWTVSIGLPADNGGVFPNSSTVVKAKVADVYISPNSNLSIGSTISNSSGSSQVYRLTVYPNFNRYGGFKSISVTASSGVTFYVANKGASTPIANNLDYSDLSSVPELKVLKEYDIVLTIPNGKSVSGLEFVFQSSSADVSGSINQSNVNGLADRLDEIESDISAMVNLIYPVGSIYMSVNSTSPATLFGGTWEQLKDKFLLASGDTYPAGNTGGEATHTLTTDEMPSHTHTQNSHNHTQNAHNHTPTTTNNKYLTTNQDIRISGSERAWASRVSSEGTHYVYVDISNFSSSASMNEEANTKNTTATNQSATATNQNTGGGQAHNNMPPYLAVYMWKRTA